MKTAQCNFSFYYHTDWQCSLTCLDEAVLIGIIIAVVVIIIIIVVVVICVKKRKKNKVDPEVAMTASQQPIWFFLIKTS